MAVYNTQGVRIDSTASSSIVPLSDYGDLTAAGGFNNAFDAAIADTGIGGVSIPFGTYVLTGQLVMRSDFIIEGNGATLRAAANSNVFRFTDNENCVIRNLIIDMNQTKLSTYGTGMIIADGANLEFRHIVIKNIGVRGIIAYPSDAAAGILDNFIFDDVHMEGIGEENTSEPLYPSGIIAVNVANAVIKNCYASGMTGFSLEYKNFMKNSVMSDNVVEDCTRGIMCGCDRASSEMPTAENLTFTGNIVRGSQTPFFLIGCENVTATGNVIDGGQSRLSICSNVIASGNIFQRASGYSGALIKLDGDNDVLLGNNKYIKGSADLLEVTDGTTNVIVNGMLNGAWIHAVNPSSGTPT